MIISRSFPLFVYISVVKLCIFAFIVYRTSKFKRCFPTTFTFISSSLYILHNVLSSMFFRVLFEFPPNLIYNFLCLFINLPSHSHSPSPREYHSHFSFNISPHIFPLQSPHTLLVSASPQLPSLEEEAHCSVTWLSGLERKTFAQQLRSHNKTEGLITVFLAVVIMFWCTDLVQLTTDTNLTRLAHIFLICACVKYYIIIVSLLVILSLQWYYNH